MKKAHKVAFAAMLAVGLIASSASANESDLWYNSAIHVNGTWTKATENGLNFGDVVAGNTIDGFRTRRAVFVTPETRFDYGIGYTYHFLCSRTRLFFHYDHFSDAHHRDDARHLASLGIPFLEQTANVAGFGIVHNKSDEFTIGLDRRLAFGRCYTIDTAVFLEWDRVRRSFYEEAAFTDEETEDLFRRTRDTYNRFKGFGPGVGVKGRGIPFCCPYFGLFASFSSAILYGKNNFESIVHAQPVSQGLNGLIYHLDPDDTHSLVNKFDITFGVDYKRKFQMSCDAIQLSLALGMRYVNYINIFKNGNTYFNPLSPADPSYAANTGHAEDWGRIGPFLQFRIGGADA